MPGIKLCEKEAETVYTVFHLSATIFHPLLGMGDTRDTSGKALHYSKSLPCTRPTDNRPWSGYNLLLRTL